MTNAWFVAITIKKSNLIVDLILIFQSINLLENDELLLGVGFWSDNFLYFLWYSVDKGNLGVPQLPGQGCSFHSFRTNTYKLSFTETPSGIKVSLTLLLPFLFMFSIVALCMSTWIVKILNLIYDCGIIGADYIWIIEI